MTNITLVRMPRELSDHDLIVYARIDGVGREVDATLREDPEASEGERWIAQVGRYSDRGRSPQVAVAHALRGCAEAWRWVRADAS